MVQQIWHHGNRKIISISDKISSLVSVFEEEKIELKAVPNLCDQVWGAARPERPLNEVKVHTVEFAGQPV